MSVLCLPHHCVLEADHLSGFTGSQMKRNFASPTTDLGELNDEIRDFEVTFRWDSGLRVDIEMIKTFGDIGMG